MRLFIAAHFPEETNQRLLEFNNFLKENARGNFTKPQNLHMTLIFLGETDSKTADKIVKIMENTIPNHPVTMKFEKIGRFKRGNESLVWAGGDSQKLSEIHQQLSTELQNTGINQDLKKFVPHVTLGRRIQFKTPSRNEKEIDEFLASINAEFETSISKISLMESELTSTGPNYKELFTIIL
ncbi:2'-5' RNA ligase [Methanimicrococcus blatticola]|uniref:RNA 2',3'-cyclic phosphodiesterase n=2 Tax=Methanimicrococcus blatticola TaxID=91560 RepID=A0A484F8H0_9EURY|nr:2'-5' RNA ligase [Methanimicrococcus blatticola]